MGTGYVRQSAADIAQDLPIDAPPLNKEFNAIKDAFDGSTGHTHDGTTGEGAKIPLTTSVEGILPQSNGGTGVSSTADLPISTATQTELNKKAPLASPALTGTPTTPNPAADSNNTTIANTNFVKSTLLTHTSNTNNPHAVTKNQVGLGNVDNTSDANKPISTATQTALDAKASSTDLTTHTSNTSNPHSVTKAQVGLGNVDNTSDVNKPISTAVQAALDTTNVLLKTFTNTDLNNTQSITYTLPDNFAIFRIKVIGIAATSNGIFRLRVGPKNGTVHTGSSDYAFNVYGRDSQNGAVSATVVGDAFDMHGTQTTNDVLMELLYHDGTFGGRASGIFNMVGKTQPGVDFANTRGFICNPIGIKKVLQFISTTTLVASGTIKIYGER